MSIQCIVVCIHIFILQAPPNLHPFVWRVYFNTCLLVRIPGLFCVRGLPMNRLFSAKEPYSLLHKRGSSIYTENNLFIGSLFCVRGLFQILSSVFVYAYTYVCIRTLILRKRERVCVCERERERERVCVCVYTYTHASNTQMFVSSVLVYVYTHTLPVRERERERDRGCMCVYIH